MDMSLSEPFESVAFDLHHSLRRTSKVTETEWQSSWQLHQRFRSDEKKNKTHRRPVECEQPPNQKESARFIPERTVLHVHYVNMQLCHFQSVLEEGGCRGLWICASQARTSQVRFQGQVGNMRLRSKIWLSIIEPQDDFEKYCYKHERSNTCKNKKQKII